MKIKISFCSICHAVTVLALLQMAPRTSTADDVTVVVPNEFENAEAPEAGGIPTGPFRFQQVFAAAQFPSLGEGQQIVSFAMRPDAQVTDSTSFTLSDTVIRMSTTTKKPGELSDVFSENVGADEIVVFEGDLALSTANSGPAEGPKDFDFVWEMQTPFSYDPTNNKSLLFDVTVSTGTDLTIVQTTDFVAQPGPDFEEVAAFTLDADMATGRWGGNVVRFTIVPEPGAFLPACIGFLLMASACRTTARCSRTVTADRPR